jgi:uncharacterized lipoprotein YmbA
MYLRKRIVCMLGAAGMVAVLSGCFGTSPASRFYTLTPGESRGVSAEQGVDVVVRVGPVSLPSYLERRQIVTRNGRNGIEIAEFERWGGSLDDEIIRLLVNVLSQRLAGRGISVVPWRSTDLVDAPTVYRIPFSIDRFDGKPGETVVLNASWAVVMKKDNRENVLIARESSISEAVGGKGYDALVTAMGKAVERFGKEIFDSIAAQRGNVGMKPEPGVQELK